MSDAALDIIIKAKNDAQKALKDVHGQLDDVERKGHSAAGGIDKLAGVLKGALVAAIGAVSIKMLADGLGDMIGEAMRAEEIQADLNATLASTKGISGMTAQAVNDLSDELSKVTVFEDDVITSAQNMLLTFTQISKDAFPQATEVTLNLAQKFGSVEAAALQIGKALNDPISGVGALRKVGIQLTDEQENMIKALLGTDEELEKMAKAAGKAQLALPGLQDDLAVAELRLREMTISGKASGSALLAQRNKITELQSAIGGATEAIGYYNVAQESANTGMSQAEKMAKAQAVILGELDTEFGGLARSIGLTTDGKLKIFQNRLGNIKEEIGAKFLPVLSKMADALSAALDSPEVQRGIDMLMRGLDNLVMAIPLLWARLQGLATSVMPMVSAAADFLVQNWDTLKGALVAVGAVLGGAAVVGTFATVTTALSAVGAAIAAAAASGGLLAGLGAAIAAIGGPITLVIAAAALLGVAWAEDWGGIRTTLMEFWERTAKPALEQLAKWLQENVPRAMQELTRIWRQHLQPALQSLGSWITGTVVPALRSLWDFVNRYVVPVFQSLANVVGAAVGWALREIQVIWDTSLRPALEGLGAFLNDTAIPAFRGLGDTLGVLLTPIKNIFDGFGGVEGILRSIKGWLDAIATAISNMPTWTPPWASGSSSSLSGQMMATANSYMNSAVNTNSNNLSYAIQVNDGLSGALMLDQMRREQAARVQRYM